MHLEVKPDHLVLIQSKSTGAYFVYSKDKCRSFYRNKNAFLITGSMTEFIDYISTLSSKEWTDAVWMTYQFKYINCTQQDLHDLCALK